MTKWVTKKLGEIASLQGGFAFQSKDFADDGIPLIRIGDITAKGLNTNNSAKLPSYFLDEHTEFAIKADDTIIAMSGATVGKCTLVTEKDIPALLNQRVGRFKVKNGIDKKFVYYTVSNYSYQQKLLLDAIGGAQPNVSPRQIESVLCSIPIKADGTPDLTERRRIAGILSSADGAIAVSEALIAKYRNIKHGLLATLLQPKEGWKKVKLGEVGEIITGSTPPTTKLEYWNGEYNFYSPADFDDSVYCGKTERTVTKAGMDTGRRIPENSIMVACIASIGKIAINRTTGITNQQINTIIPYDGYNFMFLYYLLLYNVKKIKGKAAQTTIPIINKDDFSNLEFRVPDHGEQDRIASILLSIDGKIAAEQLVEEKYIEIKKGLMDKLLNK